LDSQTTSSQSSSHPPLTSDPTRNQTANASAPLNSISHPADNVSSAPGSLQPSPPPELQQSGTQGKRVRISPPSTDVPPRPQSTPSLPPKRPTAKPEETLEAFEDRTLGALFKISLREDRQQDIHGQPLIYLPGIKDDLKEQEQGPRIEVGILDQALLEAVSNIGYQKPLDYLLPCWKRVQRLYKGFRKSREDDPKFTIVREARRLCVSYCIFAITLPDIFGCVTPDRC
jgi:ubiquitin conjugation factor E4 B